MSHLFLCRGLRAFLRDKHAGSKGVMGPLWLAYRDLGTISEDHILILPSGVLQPESLHSFLPLFHYVFNSFLLPPGSLCCQGMRGPRASGLRPQTVACQCHLPSGRPPSLPLSALCLQEDYYMCLYLHKFYLGGMPRPAWLAVLSPAKSCTQT